MLKARVLLSTYNVCILVEAMPPIQILTFLQENISKVVCNWNASKLVTI